MSNACSVSVIMPVYNSEDYVAAAARSVLREKTADMELILVDDGSTDRSGAICDEIALRDSRVCVIHEENAGMCHARNIGIRAARGEYVGFADNDDEVLPGFVDANLALAMGYDADFIRFGRRLERVSQDGKVISFSEAVPTEERFLTGDELRNNLPVVYDGSDAVWASLYRREMLLCNDLHFPERFRSGMEDVWFNDQVIRVVSACAFNPRCYYVWKRRSAHSTSMKPSKNRMESIAEVLDLEYSMMGDYNALFAFPKWCSARLFKMVRDQLIMGAYAENSDSRAENQVFQSVRGLLEPYLGFMCAHNPGGVDGLMLRLLNDKRYGLLRAVVHGGVAVKRHL